MGRNMGETVEVDERGRITIPAELRRRLRGSKLRVELSSDDAIVIRPEFEPESLLKRIKAISLKGDKRRANYEASLAKERYGGLKD